MFEDAYKAWLDSACNLVEEGLGTEILCYYMASFNGSSFIQHLDSSWPSMKQKLHITLDLLFVLEEDSLDTKNGEVEDFEICLGL